MRHLLIDTDAGVDDALALVLALSSPEVAVDAVTTVSGNVGIEPSTRNVFLILDTLRPAAYPQVAQGAAAPLEKALETATHVHGADGIGNITALMNPDGSSKYPQSTRCPLAMHAAQLMIQEAETHGEELTIVALGPLTNVALAIEMNPTAMSRVGKILIMGGAFRVYGNTTPVAEFNIFVDPEAAAKVIDFNVPKTVVPLDVTEKVKMLRSGLDSRLAKASPVVAEFIKDVSAFYMDFHKVNDGFDGCFMHDPTTVALALDPTLAQTVDAEVHVECVGEYTRGMTVADLRPDHLHNYNPNCRVCVDIDAERALDLFFSKLATTP